MLSDPGRLRRTSVWFGLSALLLLAACDPGVVEAQGVTVAVSGDITLLVNLCPNARVESLDVVRLDDGRKMWAIAADTPSRETRYLFGHTPIGWRTLVTPQALEPSGRYTMFFGTASGNGGAATPEFQPDKLVRGLVISSEKVTYSDKSPDGIPEKDFWSGPCRE